MANAGFGNKPITDITALMIQRCLRKVEAKGIYETAKRLRAKIGAVFRYAVASGTALTAPTYSLRDALDPGPWRRLAPPLPMPRRWAG